MNISHKAIAHICCLLIFFMWQTATMSPETGDYTDATVATATVESIEQENGIQQSNSTILFDYTNYELTNIINDVADKMKIHIVLPQGADAIKSKLTLHIQEPISLERAWEYLTTALDMAGYSIISHTDFYTIIKKDKDIARAALPIYIDIDPNDLPSSDEYIRYLHYLSNIKVSTEADSELNTILKELLPRDAIFKFDVTTNSLLISAKANSIKDVMRTVVELDQVSFHEKMEFIYLQYANARSIANLFNENILKQTGEMNRYRLDTKKQSSSAFFSPHAKLVPIDNLNAIVALGRAQAVDRIRSFIHNFIDIKEESGKSVLHVYQLQYLDADSFAPILQQVVESARAGGTGQARAEKGSSGTEREFDEVIIKSDRPAQADELQYYGGNKLVVACRNEDWKQIKELIEKLDTPRPQVLLEILVADLSIDDTRLLGSLTRNPDKIPILNQMQFQSGQLNLGADGRTGIIADKATDPTTIAGDVLRNAFDDSGTYTDNNPMVSAAAFAPSGATVVSLSDNDGQTWSILEVLKLFSHSKILSHPHIVAVDNTPAQVRVGEQRFLEDEASGSLGGSTVLKIVPVDADLKVDITPRISANNTVNLQTKVTINEFIPGSDAKRTREVETNATVRDGSIFALGGLAQIDSNQSVNRLPVLSNIPILGWLFKQRRGEARKSSLTVFITPTIVEPRLREGVSTYTRDYIDMAKQYTREGELFDTLHQPISKWFFNSGINQEDVIEKFVAQDELQLSLNYPKVPKKRRQKKIDVAKHTLKNNIDLTATADQQQAEPIYIADNTAAPKEQLPDLKSLVSDNKNPFKDAPTNMHNSTKISDGSPESTEVTA